MVVRSPITPGQWKRIEELFTATLDLPPENRAAYLDDVCVGDENLQTEVQRLLVLHDQNGEFLEFPGAMCNDMRAGEGTKAFWSGRRVGAFKLIEPLAFGGMGSVWLADRDDDQFTQRVAVKLMNLGLMTGDLRHRFQKEQQALAQLEHPYITRLIDGGTTEEGFPFLVMEYVNGLPIDRFCDAQRLTVPSRLELFRHVCEAVHFAHQNLIIHRDLKPSNILVTPESIPKLLDFGISKLLDESAAARPEDATVTVTRAMTPRYASPEQVAGKAVTTASDVYSLGIILYELLCGRRP